MANASPAWLVIGANVWVNDSEESWRLAVLDSQADGQCTVTYTDDKSTATVPAKNLQPAGASSDAEQLAFSDLTHLPYLNEPSLLQCMKSRFKANEIYSMAGCVLIAINPCKHLNLYTPEITAKYVAGERGLHLCSNLRLPHIHTITTTST
jgi:myosin-5